MNLWMVYTYGIILGIQLEKGEKYDRSNRN